MRCSVAHVETLHFAPRAYNKIKISQLYVGFSATLKQRFKAHNDGQVPATARFLPAKLKSYVAVETKEKALDLEKYFKTGSGKAVALKRFL